MSFGIVAGVVGAVGAVGSAIVSNNASKRAGRSADSSLALQQEQLDFDYQRYEDWKSIYGPLQEDLGTYYKNLTGTEISAKEIEQIQLAGQAANDKIQQTLAQRGMANSGLEVDLTRQNILGTEIAKATSRTTADERAMQQKTGFLSLGLGQGQQISNSMSNTTSGMASTLLNRSQQQLAAGSQMASIINSGVNDITGVLGYMSQTYNPYNSQLSQTPPSRVARQGV